ncbi:MAG: hypothetical protein ACRDK4_01370 [Solirubrobacteraceae bacterium]
MSAQPRSETDERGSSRETTYEQAADVPRDKHMDVHAGDAEGADARLGDPFDPFRCRRCDELIGVYEPLAVADEQGIRISSRAAEPELDDSRAIYFHRDCFQSDEAGAETTRRRSAWRRASGADPSA